jgi:arginyl-tRNA---protein transferase
MYQQDIHNEEEKYPAGFKSFLVESPLRLESISYSSAPPAHLPTHYGSYHQMYRLDGTLIAMAVLDILPSCVSSVYFMYNKEFERFSLGKVSIIYQPQDLIVRHSQSDSSVRYGR